MKTVVVTGGAGFIGGHTAIAFHEAGYNVIGIDKNKPTAELQKYYSKFIVSEFSSVVALHIINKAEPHAIVHCAGTSLVGPSVKNPKLYYENNFVATKTLLDFVVENELSTKVIFSSSAAIYGEPVLPLCVEEDPPLPLSPYGESKLMCEMLLKSYSTAYHHDFVAFRYFNVCGADSRGRHGQEPNATHIIARILEALRDGGNIQINGNNYPTKDGTCIRDYVHVEDIAQAHLLAAESTVTGTYNLGTSTGFSNLEILETALRTANKPDYPVTWGDIRLGDPAVLVGSSEKFKKLTGWEPTHDLDSIIQTAWNWYNK